MTKPSPETIVLVKEWIFYAEEDFRNAEHTLTMTENCPFSTVCFHAQQVVEKYIKAFLARCVQSRLLEPTILKISFTNFQKVFRSHYLLKNNVCSLIMQRSVVILANGNLLIVATQNQQSHLPKKSEE